MSRPIRTQSQQRSLYADPSLTSQLWRKANRIPDPTPGVTADYNWRIHDSQMHSLKKQRMATKPFVKGRPGVGLNATYEDNKYSHSALFGRPVRVPINKHHYYNPFYPVKNVLGMGPDNYRMNFNQYEPLPFSSSDITYVTARAMEEGAKAANDPQSGTYALAHRYNGPEMGVQTDPQTNDTGTQADMPQLPTEAGQQANVAAALVGNPSAQVTPDNSDTGTTNTDTTSNWDGNIANDNTDFADYAAQFAEPQDSDDEAVPPGYKYTFLGNTSSYKKWYKL